MNYTLSVPTLLCCLGLIGCNSSETVQPKAKAASQPASTPIATNESKAAVDKWVASTMTKPQSTLTNDYQKYATNPAYVSLMRMIPTAVAINQEEFAKFKTQYPNKITVRNLGYVYDGDTFIVKPEDIIEQVATPTTSIPMGNIKVRLNNIDCPEKNQVWGQQATDFLTQLGAFINIPVPPARYEIYFKELDKYGRILGNVTALYSNGVRLSVNRTMVSSGNCFVFDELNQDDMLPFLQNVAKNSKLGIWPQEDTLKNRGEWMSPAEYRKTHPTDEITPDIPVTENPALNHSSPSSYPTASTPATTTITTPSQTAAVSTQAGTANVPVSSVTIYQPNTTPTSAQQAQPPIKK